MYTLIQAPCIPDELCARIYDFCKRLLTLPKPFCTIGLDYASRLQAERTAPGTLYQRMVISEHSLPSAPFPYQEKIFIFADPELLPEAICNALVTDTEAARVSQSAGGCMSCVVTHALQAALGDSCDIHGLRARLQALSPGDVERCFQQVVAAVEGAGGSERGQHTARLESIYRGLLGSGPAGNAPREGLQGTPLPSPNISFHLWREDEQLWKELVLFLRPLSQSCEPECLGQDLEAAAEMQDILGDCDCCQQSRFSVLSTDSGIERDLPAQEEPCAADTERSRLHRKGGIKKKLSPLDSVALLQAGSAVPAGKPPGKPPRGAGAPPEPAAPPQRLHTARVVLLGDDRVLGRLAQAFHSLRKREARRVFLTARLDLQFYHIPVVPGQPSAAADPAGPEELCEVAGYLGRADPWYESNINTLCHMIPKLATMPSSPSRALVTDLFLTDVIAYYARMGTQPVCFQVHSVKVGARPGSPGLQRPHEGRQSRAGTAGSAGSPQIPAWIAIPPARPWIPISPWIPPAHPWIPIPLWIPVPPSLDLHSPSSGSLFFHPWIPVLPSLDPHSPIPGSLFSQPRIPVLPAPDPCHLPELQTLELSSAGAHDPGKAFQDLGSAEGALMFPPGSRNSCSAGLRVLSSPGTSSCF
uniref:Phosphoinositide-3-kinase regulatory subunit 6 n=1 Tax=Cyanoderma ruficeps TaxID=181631 RepID=A0A8C3NUJ4_9PASS